VLKRTLISLGVLLLLAGVLAQDSPLPPTSFDVRLGIVENRIGRLESDVANLSVVPSQLARIESKLEALTEKSGGNTNVLTTIGLGVVMLVIGSVTGSVWQKNKQQ